jgi:predicted DCC family thiol-disulfide oxidoreductase YuxK
MARATVIYDADCGFCKFSLALLLSWDRRRVLEIVALGSPEADRLLADLTPEQRNSSWHLVDESGRRNSAGAALAPALTLLPGGRGPAALVARAPHVTERGYRWVVDHRGTLGRFVPARARRWADRVIAAHGGPGA